MDVNTASVDAAGATGHALEAVPEDDAAAGGTSGGAEGKLASGDGGGSGDACGKGGEHCFRVVAPRRWAALRGTLRKLFLGKDAPWDADDEREAKAAAAAEQRRVVQDEDGKVVKSRRQGKKEELSAQLAAAAAVAESAPEGWGRAAKRHPNLAAIFSANAARGPTAALKEARAAVEQCARAAREDLEAELPAGQAG